MSEFLKKLVSIRDTKVGTFGVVTVVRSFGEAERMFADLVSDAGTLVGKHPEDFDLWHVGDYDDSTGAITPANNLIVSGSSYKR